MLKSSLYRERYFPNHSLILNEKLPSIHIRNEFSVQSIQIVLSNTVNIKINRVYRNYCRLRAVQSLRLPPSQTALTHRQFNRGPRVPPQEQPGVLQPRQQGRDHERIQPSGADYVLSEVITCTQGYCTVHTVLPVPMCSSYQ